MNRTIQSRNRREGRYAGRCSYFNVSTGRQGRVRHRRAGGSTVINRISLRDWSREWCRT